MSLIDRVIENPKITAHNEQHIAATLDYLDSLSDDQLEQMYGAVAELTCGGRLSPPAAISLPAGFVGKLASMSMVSVHREVMKRVDAAQEARSSLGEDPDTKEAGR